VALAAALAVSVRATVMAGDQATSETFRVLVTCSASLASTDETQMS